MKNKLILAVVGMAGSGKTEAVKYLTDKLKAPKVYFGEATFDRLKQEGLEVNYENERNIREKIRKELGMGAYAVLALPKINSLLENNDIVIVESLYSWDEYKILKENYSSAFSVLAVFASPEIRFRRLTARTNERPMKNREEFETRDYSELENLAKGGPIARADYTVLNESNINFLHVQLNKIIKLISLKLEI